MPGPDRADRAASGRAGPGATGGAGQPLPAGPGADPGAAYPEFAQWCGTERTADWHVRYRAVAVVYGHLHIPRTTWYDGVPFREVSLGYPREGSGATG